MRHDVEFDGRARREGLLWETWHAIRETREGRVGLVLLVIGIGTAAVGPLFTSVDPIKIVGIPAQPSSAMHLLGTDALGRDVLSRVLHGGRQVVLIPAVSMALTFATLGILGMVMGYRGGAVDRVGSRGLEVLLGIPPYMAALVVFAGFGTRPELMIVAILLVFGPRIARVVRGIVQSVAREDYVLAAQARGERVMSILLREIFPNVAGPLLAELALRFTYSVIFVAGLNFLGLGVQPPAPNWGVMASENRAILMVSPWATLVPAAMIGILCIGVSFVADSITERLGLHGRRRSRFF